MISLLRIDDRLIHAQVVVGWGRILCPDRIVVADNETAACELDRNLFTMAVPPEIKVSILTLKEAVGRIHGGVFDREKVILLVKDPRAVLKIMDLGLEVHEVNVGGLHYCQGRTKVIEGLYLDDEAREALRELVKRGVTL